MQLSDDDRNAMDDLFVRLEAQLDEIEKREMLRKPASEDLESCGFSSAEGAAALRAPAARATDIERLIFESGVEFERLDSSAVFENLTIEKVRHLRDVERGALIAVRGAGERAAFGAGAHVTMTVKDGKECYAADARGKVLIIRDKLHVFPSDIDATAPISIAPDAMTAVMDCAPSYGAGAALTAELVRANLARKGVTYGIDDEAISRAVAAAQETGERRTGVTVARGTAPRAGRPGRANLRFDTSQREYDFAILPDGRIDYKNSRHIVTASAGDLLAVIEDPAAGVPGVNVLGQAIPAQDGGRATLTAGAGVRVAEDGRSFFAEIDGCIMLNGSVLEVVNTYIIRGDVDYSTGNINFNGNVYVNGSVLEGFEVHAQGDIAVLGNVECARLEAGRNVVVKGGVQGRGKGLVRRLILVAVCLMIRRS